MSYPSVPLKHLCSEPPEYGLNIPASEYVSEGIRLIRTTDISEHGALRSEAPVFIDPAAAVDHGLGGGDLLLSRSGTLGRALIWPHLGQEAVFAGYLVRFRPSTDRVDPRFLWYATQTTPFQRIVQLEATQSTIANFNAQRYANLSIPAPPLDEQRQISGFLDKETARLDGLVRQKQRLLALLDEKRAAIARAAVSGELSNDDQPRTDSHLIWLRTIPSHWRIAKLSLVAKLGTGHTPSRSEMEYWETERDIPWLTTGDIERFRNDRCDVLAGTRESISRAGLENSSAVLHPAGTVALSRTASVGFSVIMGRDMATSQDFVTWTCSPLLEPRFLLLCLRAMREDLLGRLAMGSTHKTIYMPDIQGLRIPLPPLGEQIRAVELAHEETERIDELAALVRRQLPLLRERREALITAAVAGEIDPTLYRAAVLTP